MCLGVPGKVLDIQKDALGLSRGKVEFGGIIKEVNLTYTPEVKPGEYVVVHVGFSISKLNEQEAQQVFSYLRGLDQLKELELPEEGKS
jgi:hydrogenase expression/formation protein HypC